MKDKRLSIRLSERRMRKLQVYAASKEKTVTQIIEDYIDRLSVPDMGNPSSTS